MDNTFPRNNQMVEPAEHLAHLQNTAHNSIRGADRQRHALLWLAAVVIVISLGTLLLIRSAVGPRVVNLPDGSVLTIAGVSVGTNHVVYKKPWDRVIRAIPFLPKRIHLAAEPFGWRSSSHSLVVWCSWRGLMPTSPPPEFVLVDEAGTESPPLQPGPPLVFYKDMTTVDELKGIFGVSQSVPHGKVSRIRVYQTDGNQTRVRAADLEFKNSTHLP